MIRILGNNIGAMCTALELNRLEIPSTIMNPSDHWGGHFSGIQFGEYQFDIGMIFFEFNSFNDDVSADIKTYQEEVRNDCGRFFSSIRKYIDALEIPYKQVLPNKIWRNNQFYSDFMISDKLDALTEINSLSENQIAAELKNSLDSGSKELHPSKKKTSDLFKNTSYNTVSIMNHGKTLHERFFEPFFQKIFSRTSEVMPALYHRLAWLPLYYPETLFSVLDNKHQKFAPANFYYPYQSSFRNFVKKLKDKLELAEHVHIDNRKYQVELTQQKLNFNFADGTQTASDKIVWALDQEALVRLIKKAEPATPEKTTIGFCFVVCQSNETLSQLSAIIIPDESLIPYRITNQTSCSYLNSPITQLCVEFNIDYAATRGVITQDDLKKMVLKTLITLDAITSKEEIFEVFFPDRWTAIAIPSQKNFELYNQNHELIKNSIPSFYRIGQSASFGSGSFNDQIVQALKFAAQMDF